MDWQIFRPLEPLRVSVGGVGAVCVMNELNPVVHAMKPSRVVRGRARELRISAAVHDCNGGAIRSEASLGRGGSVRDYWPALARP